MLTRKADAQSKVTTYAGVPKSVKIWTPVQVNPWAINTPTVYSYRDVLWNYGGFTFSLGGAVHPIAAIVVQEPGLYNVEASFYADRPSTPAMSLWKNGIAPGNAGNLDGFRCEWSMPAAARGAAIVANTTVECKTNDYFQIVILVDTGMNPNPAYFGITKLGGQY